MTPEQDVVLAAAINADTDQRVIDALLINDMGSIANVYNEKASPDFWVYRTNVNADEVRREVRLADIAAMTATNKDRVLSFFTLREEFDGSNADTRDAFTDALGGAAGANSRNAIALLWTETARKAEKLFAVGAGSTGSPATRGFVGTLSSYDIAHALGF